MLVQLMDLRGKGLEGKQKGKGPKGRIAMGMKSSMRLFNIIYYRLIWIKVGKNVKEHALTWCGIKDGSSMNYQKQNCSRTRARLMGRGVGRGWWGWGLHASTQHSIMAFSCYSWHECLWKDAICKWVSKNTWVSKSNWSKLVSFFSIIADMAWEKMP